MLRGLQRGTRDFGVESGSDRLLRTVGKGTNRDLIIEAFRLTAEAGIRTHAHFIVGLPGEGEGDLEATKDLMRRIAPDTVTVGIFTPLPGSRLYRKIAGDAGLPELEGAGLHIRVQGRPDLPEDRRTALEGLPARLYRFYYLRPAYVLRSLLRCRSFEEVIIKARGALSVFEFSFAA